MVDCLSQLWKGETGFGALLLVWQEQPSPTRWRNYRWLLHDYITTQGKLEAATHPLLCSLKCKLPRKLSLEKRERRGKKPSYIEPLVAPLTGGLCCIRSNIHIKGGFWGWGEPGVPFVSLVFLSITRSGIKKGPEDEEFHNTPRQHQNWVRTGGHNTCGKFRKEDWAEPGYSECSLADHREKHPRKDL